MADGTSTAKRDQAPEPELAEVATIWESQLAMTDRGYAASVGNIELILRNHPAWAGQLRYDARGDRVVVGQSAPIADSVDSREWRDSDDARLAVWLERSQYQIRISPSAPALIGAVGIVAERCSYDAVRDWLGSLEWTGGQRCDRLCPDYFGAEDTPVNRAFGAKWMIGAVARVFEPGAQVDHVLVLVGPQGTGKSTAVRLLAIRPEWFADSLPAQLGGKDAAEYLRGPWLIELAELDALGRSEVTAVKAFITRRHDRYRAAYARRTASHGRRCVFVASTNEEAFLRDATGNRRFWPVTVGNIDLAALERDRAQLWAEAVHRYRQGEPWHLTDRDLVAAAAEAQEERFQGDAWEPVIAGYLARQERVTVGEVLQGAIGLEPERWTQPDQNRVARCLQRLKWERVRRRDGDKGGLKWAYERVKP